MPPAPTSSSLPSDVPFAKLAAASLASVVTASTSAVIAANSAVEPSLGAALASPNAAASSVARPVSSSAPPGDPPASGSAPGGTPQHKTQIIIGYESALGFLDESKNAPQRPILTLLHEAFPSSKYELVLKSYHREDLEANVGRSQIDVGLLRIGSADPNLGNGVVSPSTQKAIGVDMLTVPVGYSVIATRDEDAQSVPADFTGWLGKTCVFAFSLALSMVAFILVAYFLNFRWVAAGRWPSSAVTRLDPRLSCWPRVCHFMFRSASGWFFTAVWCALGVTLAMRACETPSGVGSKAAVAIDVAEQSTCESNSGSAGTDTVLERAAKKAACISNPEDELHEFRGDKWVRCRQGFACLQNYDNGTANALFGPREALCWHAKRIKLEHPLRISHEVAIPNSYALLVPVISGAGAASDVKSRVLGALETHPYPVQPFRACEDDKETQ
jgi:hypothetical protein